MSDIISTEKGKHWFAKLGQKIENIIKSGKGKVAGFDLGEGVMKMLGGFSVLRLTGMLGMMDVNFTKEELIELNNELNKIDKR